ncbi:hypothetical protein F4818DRAFT_452394 [Hypoxylon cercidicola]|nr:hypothetical protein F4818DRAFT_452394 [Hypoxylon cercidicola]
MTSTLTEEPHPPSTPLDTRADQGLPMEVYSTAAVPNNLNRSNLSIFHHGSSIYSQDLQDDAISPMSPLHLTASSGTSSREGDHTVGRVGASSPPRSNSPNTFSFQSSRSSLVMPSQIPQGESLFKNKASSIHTKKGWQPSYLGILPQILFLALFLGFIAGIQALVHVSKKEEGFAPSKSGLHYLSTYGPMFILTLATAFWSRVDFQAKLVSPWAHMSQGPTEAERSLLLDYLSALQPLVTIRALRNRDWAVAASSSCTLVLRLVIVLSTALIVLSPTRVHRVSTPIVLRSSFVDNGTELDQRGLGMDVGSIPYYTMNGLMEKNLTCPDGTSNTYAFQDIEANMSSDAQLHATVEGFQATLDCKPAGLRNYSRSYSGNKGWLITNLTLTSENCNGITSPLGVDTDTGTQYFGRVGLAACDDSNLKNNTRLYVFFGEVSSPNGSAEPTQMVVQSKQLLCQPSYSIDTIDIIRNRTDVVHISTSENHKSRDIPEIHPVTIMSAFLASLTTPISLGETAATNVTVNETTGEVAMSDIDIVIAQALLFTGHSQPSLSSLTESLLGDSITQYYQQYTVFLARSILLDRASILSTGTLETEEQRLIVSSVTGYIMTALLSICILLNLVVMLRRPRIILSKNPTSILGTAIILAKSPGCVKSFYGLGPASISTIANRIQNIKYELLPRRNIYPTQKGDADLQISANPESDINKIHYLNAPEDCARAPLVLRSWCIYAIYLTIVGIIIALEAILRYSQANDGVADISGGEYIQYVWTVIPALIMSLISMYFSAVDFEVRSLVPYSKLKDGAPFGRSINLDMLDKSMPRLLWTEYQTRSLAALATSTVLVVSSLFTIFTGSLYAARELPVTIPIALQTTGSFMIHPDRYYSDPSLPKYGQTENYGQLASSLILDSNLSYPAFTYENLAFPEFSILTVPHTPQVSPSDAVNSTVPALRSRMSCRRYGRSEINMEVTTAATMYVPPSHGSRQNILAIDIEGELCVSRSIPTSMTHNVQLQLDQTPEPNFLFGQGEWCSSDGSRGLLCCSDFLYVWGHKTNSSSQAGNSVSALACNETIEAVDTTVAFFGANLRIDPSSPPTVNNGSARQSTVDVHSSYDIMLDNWFDPYFQLAGGPNSYGYVFDPFFDLLTSSRYGIPSASLDDPRQEEMVADAIVFQHGIIRAQTLNSGFRGPANSTNATLANPPINLDVANDAATYNATLSSATGRRRLVQDVTSTRILEALLAATLLLSMLGRLLMPSTRLLPRAPTSIANVAALISNGNTLHIWPHNVQQLSDEELEKVLGTDNTFHLGWPVHKDGSAREGTHDDQQQEFTARFGIYVKNASI